MNHGPRELSLIREYDMLPKGSVVLCAVSGGADSIYLLQRLYQLRGPLRFTLIAVHYNHHLRGNESDRDETFVREFVSRHCPAQPLEDLPPVPLTVGHGDVAAEAAKRKRGIEETAREMRYRFFYETAERFGADRIATAHNAGDNLETMLLHLVRGTGLQGLTGIPPRQGKLIRPLLTTTRQEIEAELCARHLPYVEDSSNSDPRYTRNRLRHQVLPLLAELNPSLGENSMDTIRYLRADNDYLNAQAAEISKKAVAADGTVSLPAAFVSGAPGPVAVRVVRQLLGMTPSGSTDCTGAHLEAIVALCRGEDPSARLSLPRGLTARREYERLIITGLPLTPPPLEPMEPHQGENPVPGTSWTVVLEDPPWPGLVVRPRQTGDEITLPNGHKRTLKKLFIDKKIPRAERETVPVVADSTGILAVAGIGPNPGHPRFRSVQIISTERGEKQ